MVSRILEAADLREADRILEIGPGLGGLTERILPRVRGSGGDGGGPRPGRAPAGAARHPGLTVREGDALAWTGPRCSAVPPTSWWPISPTTSPARSSSGFSTTGELFSRLVLMFQKEVGERLCARPGTRDYGILSVFCQLWFDMRRVAVVPPGAFFPLPRCIRRSFASSLLPGPRIPLTDEAFFRRVVKGAFAQRRKTLRNTLTAAGFRDGLDAALEQAGIDPGRRGETLSLEEFGRLAELLRRGSPSL